MASVTWSGNGVDYISTPITAIFSVGTRSVTISIPVRKDDIVEGTETFSLNIMVPSSENNTRLGKQSTAMVHIRDSTG